MRWRPESPSGGGPCWGSRSVCERGERERQPTDPPERSLPRAPRRPGGVGGEAPAAQARYDPRRNRPRDQARAARAGRRRRPRAARVRGLAAATVFRGGPRRGGGGGSRPPGGGAEPPPAPAEPVLHHLLPAGEPGEAGGYDGPRPQAAEVAARRWLASRSGI